MSTPVRDVIATLHDALAQARATAGDRAATLLASAARDVGNGVNRGSATEETLIADQVDIWAQTEEEFDQAVEVDVRSRNLCPVCEEFAATDSFRGRAVCVRCRTELQGW